MRACHRAESAELRRHDCRCTPAWAADAGTWLDRSAAQSVSALERGTADATGAPDSTAVAADDDASRAFDFLHGQWIVEHRRQIEGAPDGSTWIEFDAVHTCRRMLAGHGHLEEIAGDDCGATAMLRLFDVAHGVWTIHRVDSTEGVLRPPLTGRFEDGIGVFVGEERRPGRRVLVRQAWTRTAGRPHWEQAVSDDDGASWETEWIMDFNRVQWPQ